MRAIGQFGPFVSSVKIHQLRTFERLVALHRNEERSLRDRSRTYDMLSIRSHRRNAAAVFAHFAPSNIGSCYLTFLAARHNTSASSAISLIGKLCAERVHIKSVIPRRHPKGIHHHTGPCTPPYIHDAHHGLGAEPPLLGSLQV